MLVPLVKGSHSLASISYFKHHCTTLGYKNMSSIFWKCPQYNILIVKLYAKDFWRMCQVWILDVNGQHWDKSHIWPVQVNIIYRCNAKWINWERGSITTSHMWKTFAHRRTFGAFFIRYLMTITAALCQTFSKFVRYVWWDIFHFSCLLRGKKTLHSIVSSYQRCKGDICAL